jgi:hypothetical protein
VPSRACVFVRAGGLWVAKPARRTYRGLLADAIKVDDVDSMTTDTTKARRDRAAKLKAKDDELPATKRKYRAPITTKELERRFRKIDRVRHRKHWVDITGFTRNTDNGKANTKTVADGTIVIKAKAPTQKEVIAGIEGTIIGTDWDKLTGARVVEVLNARMVPPRVSPRKRRPSGQPK